MSQELTNDEVTVLTLSSQGQSIAAIARWKEPCDSLVAKGLLNRHDQFNHSITIAGNQKLAEHDKQLDSNWFELGNKIQNAQTQAQQSLEQAAIHLAHCLKASTKATGDTYENALRNWMPILSAKVREHLK